jgi:hypothetical protein
MELEGLETLMFNNFHVIVKYVSENEFSEEKFKKNLEDIQWIETNEREHMKVISLIMKNSTVIPYKFGTIYNTKADLEKFIANYADSLIEKFHHIEGKEEWMVKIYCDRKALNEQIDELSEEAATLEKQIMASSPGKAFLLKIKKTDLIENEIDRLCKVYVQRYYDELKILSESISLNNLLPKEFTGRRETMILNAAFLINKDKMTDFKNTAETLREKNGNSGFIFEITGPCPPFSFISIKEKQ